MLTTDVTTTLGNVSIGLSKQLKDLLTSDLTDDIVNVGGTDKRVRIASVWGDGFPDIPATSTGAMISSQLNDYSTIFLNTSDSQNYSSGVGNAYSNGIYVRSVLVYIPSTEYLGTDEDNLYAGNQGDVRIVTSVNIQDVHMYAYAWRENGSQMEAEDENSIYINNLRTKLRDNETNNTVTARGGCVYPAWLIVVGDKIAIWTGALCRAYDNYGNRSLYGNGNYNFPTFNGFNRMTVTSRMLDDENTLIYPGGSGREIEYVYQDVEDYKIKWGFYEYYPYYWTAPVDRVTKAMYMDYVSRAGLYFVVGSGENAKRYKPIISNGIVTGYTDDLNIKSDIDNWDNIHSHDIPPEPIPEPIDPSDYDDDPSDDISINLGAPSGAGAFANVWLMTASELQSLSVWMNGTDLPYDFSPMNNVISLGMSGIDLSQILGTTEELVWTTYGSLVPTTEISRKIIHSGVSSKLITGTVVSYNLGSITINRRMQERGVPFLDYDCGLEIYIPFCGIIPLDIQACMDKTLSVQLNCDVTTGSCSAVVFAGTSPVGYTSGSFMSSLPIASNEFGLVKAAILEGTVKTLFAGLGTAANAVSRNPVAAAQGLMETGTRAARTFNKGNSNMTSMSGSFGGADAFRLPKEAYIKISRPRFKIPLNYGHTVSKIRVKTELISECSGLTICINPDTSGLSCTDDERKLIKEKLEQGIIC